MIKHFVLGLNFHRLAILALIFDFLGMTLDGKSGVMDQLNFIPIIRGGRGVGQPHRTLGKSGTRIGHKIDFASVYVAHYPPTRHSKMGSVLSKRKNKISKSVLYNHKWFKTSVRPNSSDLVNSSAKDTFWFLADRLAQT